MSLTAAATMIMERVPMPDTIVSTGISAAVERTRRRLALAEASVEAAFAQAMAARPIAVRPDLANAQHYELPVEFFGLILGKRGKYSCCLYDHGAETLDQAEECALTETASHADLVDGQEILELGCGWGSLSLWMAERFPAARITAVSNSRSQRAYIEAEAAAREFRHLRVVTADMNEFDPGARFDRVVSVEMFEHMANWPALLARVHSWLWTDGRLFLHVFSHRAVPSLYDHTDKNDWIAQHFFTGGIMPSHDLIRHVDAPFEVEADWRWSGLHYARTARDWLANFDRETELVDAILREVYGRDAALWRRRWRIFFLATAGMFGHTRGSEWGVSHYRLRPLAAR